MYEFFGFFLIVFLIYTVWHYWSDELDRKMEREKKCPKCDKRGEIIKKEKKFISGGGYGEDTFYSIITTYECKDCGEKWNRVMPTREENPA